MPKIIDHEKRKVEILRRAFSLFSKKGYQNTSLSNLADECKISRPTLYLYFKDKEEIFRFAIKQFTDSMIVEYKRIARKKDWSIPEKLIVICHDIIKKCNSNEDFIKSLADFIINMRHQGVDAADAIARRTVRLKYLLSQLVSYGIREKEIKDLESGILVEQLMAIIQSYIFQIALLGGMNLETALLNITFYVNNLRRIEES